MCSHPTFADATRSCASSACTIEDRSSVNGVLNDMCSATCTSRSCFLSPVFFSDNVVPYVPFFPSRQTIFSHFFLTMNQNPSQIACSTQQHIITNSVVSFWHSYISVSNLPVRISLPRNQLSEFFCKFHWDRCQQHTICPSRHQFHSQLSKPVKH